MKVYYSNDFVGVCPVGTAAIIVANTEAEARELLEQAHPLAKERAYTVQKLNTRQANVVVLCDGNY